MTRERLEQFVMHRLDMAKKRTGIFKETLFNQAFGAVEFYCECHPDEEVSVAEWWNNDIWKEFLGGSKQCIMLNGLLMLAA